MRKSEAHTTRTRARILEAAAQFLPYGIIGAGLSGLMTAAGLTQGGHCP